jgi:hypothetical protein
LQKDLRQKGAAICYWRCVPPRPGPEFGNLGLGCSQQPKEEVPPRRQPNSDIHYRFWQRGGGYDRNVHEITTLRAMIEYIHLNPVRRGLVKEVVDWPWSSARFYAGLDNVNLAMDPLVEFIGF